MNAPQIDFTEGVFIDYQAFGKRNITPIYEFGFGLSYTTFEYSNLKINGTMAGTYTPKTGMTQPAPVLGNYSTNCQTINSHIQASPTPENTSITT